MVAELREVWAMADDNTDDQEPTGEGGAEQAPLFFVKPVIPVTSKRARRLAKQQLKAVLPGQSEDGPSEKVLTAEKIAQNQADQFRASVERQREAAALRAALRKGKEAFIPDEVKPKKRHPNTGRSTAPRDPLLSVVEPLSSIHQTLVGLCKAKNRRYGQFIEDYCRLLQAKAHEIEPRDRRVTRAEMARLAAREEYGWGVPWAYKLIRWSYHTFSSWAFSEYQAGHIFTPEELEPMRDWLIAQEPKAAKVADDAQNGG